MGGDNLRYHTIITVIIMIINYYISNDDTLYSDNNDSIIVIPDYNKKIYRIYCFIIYTLYIEYIIKVLITYTLLSTLRRGSGR